MDVEFFPISDRCDEIIFFNVYVIYIYKRKEKLVRNED